METCNWNRFWYNFEVWLKNIYSFYYETAYLFLLFCHFIFIFPNGFFGPTHYQSAISRLVNVRSARKKNSTLIQNSRPDKKVTFPNNRPKEIKFLSMYSAWITLSISIPPPSLSLSLTHNYTPTRTPLHTYHTHLSPHLVFTWHTKLCIHCQCKCKWNACTIFINCFKKCCQVTQYT